MNAPITALYQTGQTLYAVVIRNADGYFWRFDTSVFEVYASGHWADYVTPMTEFASSGIYRASYPVAAPVALTTEVIFAGSGVLGDTPVTTVQSQGVNLAAAGQSFIAGLNFAAVTGSEQTGTISGTPSSPLLLPTNLASTTAGAYAGSAVRMTSGALIQQTAYITAYDGAGGLTINGFPSGNAPASGDLFVIL